MMNPSPTSKLVAEYRGSPFAAIWRKLWNVFPSFALKHSPFFLFEDGAVLWNQGFGSIAFLKENRSLTIQWSLGETQPGVRIVHLGAVQHWDPPHEREHLTESELIELRQRLRKRFETRGENVVFR